MRHVSRPEPRVVPSEGAGFRLRQRSLNAVPPSTLGLMIMRGAHKQSSSLVYFWRRSTAERDDRRFS